MVTFGTVKVADVLDQLFMVAEVVPTSTVPWLVPKPFPAIVTTIPACPSVCLLYTSVQDSHLWPGEGTIDWKQAMELLRSAPQTPPLLLELEANEKVNPLEKLGATFEKLQTD